MRQIANDPHRHILDQLVRLSGPRLDWVPLADLESAVDVDGFEPGTAAPYLADYLAELEAQMAVERDHDDATGTARFRPTTLAVEAVLEADEPL